MVIKMPYYVWENPNWPNFLWKSEVLLQPLADVRNRQGRFLRAMEDLGFEDSLRAYALAIEEDAIQTAAIGGSGSNVKRYPVQSSVLEATCWNYGERAAAKSAE